MDAATLRSHPFAAGAGDAAAQRATLQPLAAALVAANAHAAADASDALSPPAGQHAAARTDALAGAGAHAHAGAHPPRVCLHDVV